MIHEILLMSDDFGNINIKDYLTKLGNNLILTYKIPQNNVRIEIDAKPALLDLKTAMPCALVINELVSNAVKHAFPDGREGKIRISFQPQKTRATLSVSDDGIGFPDGFNPDKSDTMGFKIMTLFARQLGGEISIDQKDKTRVNLEFPLIMRTK